MGLLSQGILGPVVNKVGNVVFRMSMGKNVASGYQPNIHDAKTPAQLTQRARFTFAVDIGKKALDAFIDSTHNAFKKNKTKLNQIINSAFRFSKSEQKFNDILVYSSPVFGSGPRSSPVIYDPFIDSYGLPDFQTPFPNDSVLICNLVVNINPPSATRGPDDIWVDYEDTRWSRTNPFGFDGQTFSQDFWVYQNGISSFVIDPVLLGDPEDEYWQEYWEEYWEHRFWDYSHGRLIRPNGGFQLTPGMSAGLMPFKRKNFSGSNFFFFPDFVMI